ncbi:MAG: hypothetical protein KC535_00235 [Nanoarchaeota archaeon]|nr:hypothetical protein [Nanoarchaeota archaeon]
MASSKPEQGPEPIIVRTIFEVIGRPKDHVEQTIKAYLENIKTDEEITVQQEEFEPAQEIEEGMFSAICEAELKVNDIEKLTWLCMNFSPASVEVISPPAFSMEDKDITHWLNDLLSKLHEVGVQHKALSSQNEGLVRNFNAMTRNAIILTLKEPQDKSTISQKIGLAEDFTEKFLEALIKEKKVKKEKNKYALA